MTKTETKPVDILDAGITEINTDLLKNDKCVFCGASEGIHRYETYLCPKNGREETRVRDGKPVLQEWQNTRFKDGGVAEFFRAAPGIASSMDALAARLLAAPAAKPGSQRREADLLALHEARKLMELGGISRLCKTYPKLKALGIPRA